MDSHNPPAEKDSDGNFISPHHLHDGTFLDPFSSYVWDGPNIGLGQEAGLMEDMAAFWPGLGAAVNAHMGNISYKVGRKIYWDADKSRFIKDNEANSLLEPKYHNGWTLPSY